jgi:hypothetical protein
MVSGWRPDQAECLPLFAGGFGELIRAGVSLARAARNPERHQPA